ncbi:MAG TPA: cytochrome c oxidase assembly protein [Acidimicrobiales bacterium]|jgi:putative copper resistance protein D|nr:cytochrome c oxidase assembly protein [Acidimicrobiales bacterium]
MGLTPVDFFAQARFEPATIAVVVLAGVGYGLRVRRLRGKGKAWPAYRTACFAAALVAVAVALLSGLSAFAVANFTAYGIEFSLLTLVAPLLIALSAPVSLVLQGSDHPERAAVLDRLPVRMVTHPFFTWLAFSAALFVLFFTSLVRATIADSADRQGIYLALLVLGWLHFWPVADIDPIHRRMGFWSRILYLLLMFPVYAILGMTLESQVHPIAPHISMGSLHLGGAVIWVIGETVALCGAIWVFAQWLRTEERRVKSNDLANEEAAARQLALWRASRDAAARAGS